MSRLAEILDLRGRIQRKREDRRSTYHEEARLQLLVHAELAEEIEQERLDRARDRREPGSFQREFELDE